MTHKTLLPILIVLALFLQACQPGQADPLTQNQPGPPVALSETRIIPPRPTHTPRVISRNGEHVLAITYTTQSGDTLEAVARRFGVDPQEIQWDPSVQEQTQYQHLIDPGQVLVIPNRLDDTTPSTRLLPDSEVIFSATSADFDTAAFVHGQNGYFSQYLESVWSGLPQDGAAVVAQVAIENSNNPRLLIALLEFRCGCITGDLKEGVNPTYLGDVGEWKHNGLYRQLVWLVSRLEEGYYGWRAGTLTHLTFEDGTQIRLSPELNAGSAALQYLMAAIFSQREDWLTAIDPYAGFPALYQQMFGDPWERAAKVEPLYPPNLSQPEMVLPWLPGHAWFYTGGPHTAWEDFGPEAAVDFNPGGVENSCVPSAEWIVSMAPGLVTRRQRGLLVVDLDGDGLEQTGWVLVYVHILPEEWVQVGTRLDQDVIIGHPSCEGGPAVSSHLHISRKYNGEWMLAGGPVPFTLSGWVVGDLPEFYKGTLSRNEVVIYSCTCGTAATKVKRDRDE